MESHFQSELGLFHAHLNGACPGMRPLAKAFLCDGHVLFRLWIHVVHHILLCSFVFLVQFTITFHKEKFLFSFSSPLPCPVLVLSRFSCVRLFATLDRSPLGSSVHGILQARILEWVAIPSSRGSSQTRDQTQVFCIARRFFTV